MTGPSEWADALSAALDRLSTSPPEGARGSGDAAPAAGGLSPQEEAEVEERLRELGYL